MADPTPDPAPGAPAGRVAQAVPGEPGLLSPPGGPGGQMSAPRSRERAVVRMPSPETGAVRDGHGAAPGRGRLLQAPAGDAPASPVREADSVPPDRSRLAAAMSEAELEEGIRALCTDLGILRFHVRDSRGMNRGLPDDILIGRRGILWRECKTAKGKLTPEQRACGIALRAAGQDWGTWKPADWFSGRIMRELAALAGLRGAA
jgi:hypothetical protein